MLQTLPYCTVKTKSLVKVTTNVCHNTHYYCSDGHYKIFVNITTVTFMQWCSLQKVVMFTTKCSERHYLKLVNIVAEHFTTNFYSVSLKKEGYVFIIDL